MTEAEALALERRWGAPGPAPNDDWRCCYRCGGWQPNEARYWCMPHRLCRVCKNDEKRGIWPYLEHWHRKNRWDADGHLLRKCGGCRQWRPLVQYYLINKNDKARTDRSYAYAVCTPCVLHMKSLHLSLPDYRRRMAA